MTILEASVGEIRQEFHQNIEEERNLLSMEILDQTVRIIRIYDDTCADMKRECQKELSLFTQHTDKNLDDRQKKLNRSLQAIAKNTRETIRVRNKGARY